MGLLWRLWDNVDKIPSIHPHYLPSALWKLIVCNFFFFTFTFIYVYYISLSCILYFLWNYSFFFSIYILVCSVPNLLLCIYTSFFHKNVSIHLYSTIIGYKHNTPYNKDCFFFKRRTKVKVLFVQLCLTLCEPMDPQGSSVHEILQARILERVAILFSRGSPWPRDWTLVSCITGGFFTVWATREV